MSRSSSMRVLTRSPIAFAMGGPSLPYGITEHVILDSEAGGSLEIIGGNVNRLPFPSSPAKPSRRSRICAARPWASLRSMRAVHLW